MALQCCLEMPQYRVQLIEESCCYLSTRLSDIGFDDLDVAFSIRGSSKRPSPNRPRLSYCVALPHHHTTPYDLRCYENFCLAIFQIDYSLLMHECSVVGGMLFRDSLLLIPLVIYAIFGRETVRKRCALSQRVIVMTGIELCSGPIR